MRTLGTKSNHRRVTENTEKSKLNRNACGQNANTSVYSEIVCIGLVTFVFMNKITVTTLLTVAMHS